MPAFRVEGKQLVTRRCIADVEAATLAEAIAAFEAALKDSAVGAPIVVVVSETFDTQAARATHYYDRRAI